MIDCSDSGRFLGFGNVLSRKCLPGGCWKRAGTARETSTVGGGIRESGLRVFFGQVFCYIFAPQVRHFGDPTVSLLPQ